MTDQQYWSNLHSDYQNQDWINKPTLFAQIAVRYFPKTGRLLDLGAGQGQDSRYFAGLGYEVVSTDINDEAIDISQKKLAPELRKHVKFEHVDLAKPLPYASASFELVYSHLALHYFDHVTTEKLFQEIERILKPNGLLAFMVNSTSDPEYDAGHHLEPDYFEIEGAQKRYFSLESTKKSTKHFRKIVLDNQGESYKDADKGVHNLIRFIGTKSTNS